MKEKNVKIILIIILVSMLIVINWKKTLGIEETEYSLMEDINYTESIEEIENPERGFYKTSFLKLSPSENKATNPNAKLTHLRIGISDFSGKVNGNHDIEFTEDALNALNETLTNIKNNNGSAIIRFAYDNFDGKADVEPSIDMILKHISQLKPVIEENKEVITYIELGFFGPWGEMHTSKICTTENASKAIDEMLNITPKEIKIGVRTPNYYAKWAGIDRGKLDKNITEEGTNQYRVGLYNDGYLGSESDLGTFANREIEIKWLEKQAMHTLYGGEVVANYATGAPLNTVNYMSKEAFKTHTTYLNSEWNNEVINQWKQESYDGEDELYIGQTGYKYIENHLGYRFVLKKSEITNQINEKDKLKIKLQIENVGFANLINNKKVTLIIEKDGKMQEIPTNIDATKWNSKEKSSIDIEVPLPENIEPGEWNIYLRISEYGDINTDNNYKCIQLANNNIWKQEIGANYIGKATILEKIDKPQQPEIPEKPEEPGTPEKPDRPQQPEIPQKPNIPESSDKIEKPATIEQTKTDTTTVTGKLPKTGSNIEIIILILLALAINIIISYIKIKKT